MKTSRPTFSLSRSSFLAASLALLTASMATSSASSTFIVGDDGVENLDISATIYSTEEDTIIGAQATGHGIVTVSDSATWDIGALAVPADEIPAVISSLTIGDAGTGSITISGDSALNNTGDAVLGAQAGSSGSVVVSGGSEWIIGIVGDFDITPITSSLTVGDAGAGSLDISENSSVVNTGDVVIGAQAGSNGTVTVSGSSSWVTGVVSGTTPTISRFTVGDAGTGSLTVSESSALTNLGEAVIGAQAGSTGSVVVSGSSGWTNVEGNLTVGDAGTGSIAISESSAFTSVTAVVTGTTTVSGETVIGAQAGSNGSVAVSGSSAWTNVAGNLIVGDGGTGSIAISESSSFTSVATLVTGTTTVPGETIIGAQAGGNGSVAVSGSSAWTNVGDLIVGDAGTGNVAIENSAFTNVGATVVGRQAGGQGSLTVSGVSAWTNVGSLTVGDAGTGSLSIVEGDNVTIAGATVIGAQADSQGSVTISDVSAWINAGSLTVGDAGTGSLSIVDGGSVTIAGATVIGAQADSQGSVTISDVSAWINAGNLTVGDAGTGSLAISGSTAFTNLGATVIGAQADSQGSLTVSGDSVWTNVGNLTVGDAGTGSLRITGGGSLSSIGSGSVGTGENGQGSVVVSGTDSIWRNTGDIFVGDAGHGTLTISDGGVVEVLGGMGSVFLSGSSGSSLNIGGAPGEEALAAGTLEAALVTSGSTGGGFVNFNHTEEDYSFVPNISGAVALQQIAGTTALTGSNSYTGDTTVFGGTLRSGGENALPESTHLIVSGASAVYDFSGYDENVQGFTLAEGTLTGEASLSSATDFDVRSGLIDETITLTGTTGLVKSGPGEVVVDGVLGYSGLTTVTGGLLTINGSILNDILVSSGNFLLGSSGTAEGNAEVTGGIMQIDGLLVGNAELSGGAIVVSSSGTAEGNAEVTGGIMQIDGLLAGNAELSGGAIVLDGSIGGNVNVIGGIFSGNGFVAGDLINSGIVSPGHSPGVLTVGENYVQTGDGTYLVEIRGEKHLHDALVIGGEAHLAGDLVVVKDKNKLHRNEKFTIVVAEEGRFGEFDDIHSNFGNTMLTLGVNYTSNSVELEVVQQKFASLSGLTSNQRSVARAVDNAASKNQLDRMFDHLNYTDVSNVPGLLSQLSPESLAAIFNIGFATSQIQNVNIERRLDDVRNGSVGFSTNGLALTNSRGTLNYDGAPIVNTRDGLTLAGFDGKSIVSKEVVAPVIEQSRWGFFATGTGEWADIETTSNARGSEFTSGGFTLGADYRVSENFVVGINAGYANTGSDLYNDGNIDVNGGRGGVYATVFGGGAYLNAAVGGGYNSYETKRGTLGGTANGDTDGGEFNALLGGGYDIHAGGFTVGPIASLQYTYIGVSGFQETGSDAPLNFGSQSQDSLRSTVGLKAAYAWNAGGVVIKPEVRAQWKHEYLDSTASIESSFVGGDAIFSVNGPDIGRDSLLLDAGASVQINPAVSVFAYYTGEIGRENYSSNAVNGGFRINF